MLLNVFGMLYTFDGWWDNQLQMTMCELVILVFLMVLLITVELVRIDPRALLHKPTDESPLLQTWLTLIKRTHGGPLYRN